MRLRIGIEVVIGSQAERMSVNSQYRTKVL